MLNISKISSTLVDRNSHSLPESKPLTNRRNTAALLLGIVHHISVEGKIQTQCSYVPKCTLFFKPPAGAVHLARTHNQHFFFWEIILLLMRILFKKCHFESPSWLFVRCRDITHKLFLFFSFFFNVPSPS